MAKKAWRALNSCNRKRHKANRGQQKDRLSELPDEILLSILSIALTMKEAARTSLLSHRWRNLWRYFPILNFEDPRDRMVNMKRDITDELLCHERNDFVRWVDLVAEDHLCSALEEFRVAFDLDDSSQPHIDKWVAFALAKRVKKLELDFTPSCNRTYSMSKPEVPRNLGSVMMNLTSLRLIYVRVTAEVIERLLHSCPFLENLCIAHSKDLTRIRASVSSLALKSLEVSGCMSIEAIDISAPDLLTFRYNGPRMELHIRNASFLSKVSVGGWRRDESINYALDSLSKYFPQLEYLSLRMSLLEELNMGINYYPDLTNLKHLELLVQARGEQSLLGWTRMIAASPFLKKLTLKLAVHYLYLPREIKKHCGHSLKSLETLEIVGFLGSPIDLELATYVLEKAFKLKEVIVVIHPPYQGETEQYHDALGGLRKFKRNLRRGVKLIVKKENCHLFNGLF